MSASTGGRVLVLMNGLGLGGTEINAVQFAAQVREQGFESVLVGPADSLPPGASIRDVAWDYGVEIRDYERQPTVRAGARLLSTLACDVSADLVHVYGQRRMRAAYLGPCRLARRPLVLTNYDMEHNPFTLRGVPLVVGTRYLAEELTERPGEVTLISPPVDIAQDSQDAVDGAAFRRAHGVREDQILVTWVGRLASEMKAPAIRDLIAAVELLDRDRVVVAVVGTGDAEAELRALADGTNDRLGRPAVRFLGAMTDPRPAYAAADVEVGMGSSAARSLAFARPVVAVGEAGWSLRFDEETADGILRNSFWSDVPVADGARRLTDQLRPLVDDAGLRERLGRFGRGFAERSFGLPAMAERLAGVYTRALAGYGPRDWARDVELELAAASCKLTRRWAPPADAGAEYELSERTVRRFRARVARGSRAVDIPGQPSGEPERVGARS